MRIGKFKMSIIYDCACDICGEYRSNIGWITPSIFSKPTATDLKREGWTYKEGIGQVCPRCNKSNESRI